MYPVKNVGIASAQGSIGPSNKSQQKANPTVLFGERYGSLSIGQKPESWFIGGDSPVNQSYGQSPDRLSPYVD